MTDSLEGPARRTSAESFVTLSPEAFAALTDNAEAFTAARIAGIMAAKRAPDLIPLRFALAITGAEIAFEPLPERNAMRIVASVMAVTGAEMEALTAATVAALTLYDMIRSVDVISADGAAAIESVRLVSDTGVKKRAAVSAPREPQRKSAAMRPSPISARGTRIAPSAIMGEVVGPRAEADPRRDAFRVFMTSSRLRATTWAKDAGVPVGEILAFLTGSSRGFSTETAAKLARAAKVKPEDMFR